MNTRNITLSVFVALFLIVLLSFIGYAIEQKLYADQYINALFINMAGKQRLFSQQMTKEVLLLVDSPPEKKAEYQKSLKVLLSSWEKSNDLIIRGDKTQQLKKYIDSLLQSIQPSYSTINSIIKYISTCDKIALAQLSDNSLIIHKLILTEPDYLNYMDKIVSQYQYEAENDVKLSVNVETAVFVAVMLLIILETFFIFLPMKRNIQNNYNALQEANSLLQKEIQKRHHIEKKIRRLNMGLKNRIIERTAQLHSSNKEIEVLAYSIAHEFQSPLRAIANFSQILMTEAGYLHDEARVYLSKISNAAIKLALLVDAILTLANLVNRKIVRENINISLLVEDIMASLIQLYPDRDVSYTIMPGLMANADKLLLENILEHLLDNALKFSSHHSSARIEFGQVMMEGVPVFYIKDDGAGFDMAYYHNIFRIFYKLHSPNEFPGIGIGLAIVDRVIRRHGGSIWAESTVEKGATFYFTLPGMDMKSNINFDI